MSSLWRRLNGVGEEIRGSARGWRANVAVLLGGGKKVVFRAPGVRSVH